MDKSKLLEVLHQRFQMNLHRHQNVQWDDVLLHISKNEKFIKTIMMMEETGGEPDLVRMNDKLFFIDMSKETPEQRRNVCYDEKARLARKKFPPAASAESMATSIGIKLLDEDMYKALQNIEPLDLKTSSWLQTPQELRNLGGALFGDCRYNRTFIYHNGADSYYGVRGFRGYIELTN